MNACPLQAQILFHLIGINFSLLKGTEYKNANKKELFSWFYIRICVFLDNLKITRNSPPHPTTNPTYSSKRAFVSLISLEELALEAWRQ